MTTEATDQQPPVEAPQAPKENVFARFAGALFSPGETFAGIARRPDILWPLLVIIVLGYLSTAVIIPRMDFESMIATQTEQMRKQNPNMTDADLERIQRFSTASAKVLGWVSPILMVIWYLLVAGVLLLAFRMMGGEGTYKQAMSATLYAWTPLLLFSIITMVVVLARNSFDPTTAATLVKSNPAFLVDMKEQPVLFALLSAFDLFTIWTVALLTFGFAALSKMSRGKSAAIVVTMWIVLIVIRVGLAALGAMRT